MSFLDMVELGSNAPAPATNFLRLFAKSDGFYVVNNSGHVWGPLLAAGQAQFPAATEVTIVSGVLTITSSHHKVDTEADAASDNLDTITAPSAPAFNLLILRPENDARTVVVKHGTGNITLKGGADVTLDDITDHILLFYDSVNTTWVNFN